MPKDLKWFMCQKSSFPFCGNIVGTIFINLDPFLLFKGLDDLLTKKNESSHQRHNRRHNDAKVTSLGSLLGLPAELSNGVAVQTKHENQVWLFLFAFWVIIGPPKM